ncbi:MAG: HPF/RaiA family ribosome-associated protein [Pseudomonadota bacterium]|nr:HPF/RaiA family ribosome-associated protein [Pseudomonadota bacterium]MDP1904385.1 HPF/RaiA family ribosome-associated protein [Pseudomonadota bacterium]MDP2354430.1 HPF/RaiA family ribosome-associated protein [Pseudomonadota bacterium]
MRIPLEVTFRHMEPSAAAEARIAEKVAKLEQIYDKLTRCHVIVEAPHEHHRQGKLFHVSIDLTVPGGELLVTRGHNHQSQAHEDVYVAIRDAFDAAKRRLDDYARQKRGDVKHHEQPPIEAVEPE